jgi:hypothetical protein
MPSDNSDSSESVPIEKTESGLSLYHDTDQTSVNVAEQLGRILQDSEGDPSISRVV